MKTVEQIMELIEEYEAAGKSDYLTGEDRQNYAYYPLRTAIEELAADARRYHWLRKTTNVFTNSKGERIDVRGNPVDWDTAIDAAMEST